MKVGIIGCGNVGSSCAFALMYCNKTMSVVMMSRNKKKLLGTVQDLQDVAYLNNKQINVGSIEDLLTTDVIIITAGRPQKISESRKNLLTDNFEIVDGYLNRLREYKGIIIIVTNPVDLLTKELSKKYPSLNIMSAGTKIDTVRLHRMTGGKGTIKGSHDDEQIVFVDGEENKDLTVAVRNVAYEIIKKRGISSFGISAVVKQIINDIQGSENNEEN